MFTSGEENIDDTIDDTIDDFNLEEEENRIIKVISKIQMNRNRACYQNVLAFAKRENHNLEMETIKNINQGLINKNIIFNKGKDELDKESFKMFQTDANHVEFSTQTQTQTQNGVEDGLEKYINDKFIETLKGSIKSEVNEAFYNHHQITEK